MTEGKKLEILEIKGGSEAFGGVAALLLDIYRHIDRDRFRFTFAAPIASSYDVCREEIRQLGGRVLDLKADHHAKGGWKKLRKHLAKHLSRCRYDVIHINSGGLWFNITVARICRKYSAAPIIVHSHNNVSWVGWKRLLSRFLKKSLVMNGDLLLACSQGAGEYMFPKNAEWQVLPNGIDFERFHFTAEEEQKSRERFLEGLFPTGERQELSGISKGERHVVDKKSIKIIGHVGRFMEQKNHGYLVDWFRDFTERYPEEKAILVLVGTGRLMERVREQVERISRDQEARQQGTPGWHFSDRIFFLGERQDMPELYRAMDLFVFPSIYEGFGLAVIEAEASGVPVIMSDHVPVDTIAPGAPVKQMDLEAGFPAWSEAAKIFLATGKKPGESFTNPEQDIRQMAEKLSQLYMTLKRK